MRHPPLWLLRGTSLDATSEHRLASSDPPIQFNICHALDSQHYSACGADIGVDVCEPICGLRCHSSRHPVDWVVVSTRHAIRRCRGTGRRRKERCLRHPANEGQFCFDYGPDSLRRNCERSHSDNWGADIQTNVCATRVTARTLSTSRMGMPSMGLDRSVLAPSERRFISNGP